MRTASEMRVMIEAWESSELTQREFAKQEGLSYTAFQYWRRRLKELDEESEPPAMVPLRIVEDGRAALECAERMEIRLGDDVTIAVPRGFDEGDLRRAVAAVRGC